MTLPIAKSSAEARTLTLWLAVIAFWGFVAILYAGQLWWLAQQPNERINLRMALTWQLTYYLAWIPFTLIVWRTTRGWLPETIGWTRFLMAHVALMSIVAVLQCAVVVAIALQLAGDPMPSPGRSTSFSTVLVGQLRGRVHMQFLVYAAIAGIGHALGLYDRYRERQVTAARLEAELSSARLDALRAQLQPHFLFNSLHSIASLARAGDNAGVVRLIAGFSELLRNVLDTGARPQSLGSEMRLVEQYLDIQHVRFGDRLEVAVELAPEAAGARVPPLIVQPLVENALLHGLAHRVEPGRVSVRAHRDGEWTAIEVEDNGVGLPSGWNMDMTSGTGLRNLSSRLWAEFGARHMLVVEPRRAGGVKATVRVPYVEA